MTHIRGTVTLFVAILSLGVVVAPPALAYKGELVNSEGHALVKNKFKGALHTTTIETTGEKSVKCQSGTAIGIETSKTAGEQTITFKECTSSGFSCKSPGQGAGVIELDRVFLSVLPPAHKYERVLTYSITSASSSAFECVGVKGQLKGSFLVPVPTEGELSTKYTFAAKQTKGVQEPSEYENAKGEKVKFSFEMELTEKFEKAGVAGAEEITFEESAEFV